MAKDREVACKYYIAEYQCFKMREGSFHDYCQRCDAYEPIPGGRPARTDNRKKKRDKISKREMREW